MKFNSKFIKVYGDSSPSFSTIKKWAAKFKRGRTSLEDDPREGRPKSATPPEIIEQVHDMVVEGYYADLTKNRYRDGIMAPEHRWNKCIVLR
jgi:transposase